ncbi:hypothetical protein JCM9533A_70390 [Catenuloplanes niger JCM 9533]
MARQAPSCAGVGAAKAAANHSRVAAPNSASAVAMPTILPAGSDIFPEPAGEPGNGADPGRRSRTARRR